MSDGRDLGELMAVRVGHSGYVDGPAALVLHLQAKNGQTDVRLRGIETVDDLIIQLVAARTVAWPWPPLIVAPQGKVQP